MEREIFVDFVVTDISSLQERLSNLPISVVISKKRPQSAPARRTDKGQRRPLSAREDVCGCFNYTDLYVK